MTDKLIMTIEQFDTILTLLEDSTVGYEDFRKIADVMQSLPMVDSEPAAYPKLASQEQAALTRFCETCEDSEGYDVPKSMMQRLAPITKDTLVDLICEHTNLTYHCTRTWQAWGVGTMTQNDFEAVNESDLPNELAGAILSKLYTSPQASEASKVEQVNRWVLLGAIGRAWCHQDNAHKVMDESIAFAVCKEIEALNLYTSPQALTLEDDGSDWFYKLQFICRVLQGSNPDKTDMQTALGMAQALKRERWTVEKTTTPLTADDVTDEMVRKSCFINVFNAKHQIANVFNLVIKHRSEA